MLLFLLTAGSVQSAHGVLYAFGTLHWHAQGISSAMIGVFWAIAVFSEIVLFFYSSAAVRRAGAIGLLIIAAAAAIVRWLVMAFDPPLAVLLPLQVLHGATYGAAHLGAIHFITHAVPERQTGTMQALYATLTAGIGMGGAMLIAGQVYDSWGGKTYLLMVVLGLVSLVSGLMLKRVWQGGEISASRSRADV